jgi:lysophospholipase L1-like esterase
MSPTSPTHATGDPFRPNRTIAVAAQFTIDSSWPEKDGCSHRRQLEYGFSSQFVLRMLVRRRRGWKTNWFLTLPADDQVSPSVLMRLSALGTVTGVQHASVSGFVDDGKQGWTQFFRGALNNLTSTYYFSHQVDEVLTGQFPNMLLIWIGHNDLDWRSQTKADALTRDPSNELSRAFVQRYEAQLRRLLSGALASKRRSVIIVFGLSDINSFFQARAKAEAMRKINNLLFPHLDSSYRYFVSMRPEHRDGMIALASLFNDGLEVMCKRLSEQLAGTEVRLVYSNAMSSIRMDTGCVLNSVDEWHLSIYGHGMLANNAYAVVYEQAQFLGWVGTNNPGG